MGIFDDLPTVDNIAKNITPGDCLLERLQSMEVTPYKLAKNTGLTQTRTGGILKGKRAITVETALKFSKYFGTTRQYWLNLQANHDIKLAKEKYKEELEAIEHC